MGASNSKVKLIIRKVEMERRITEYEKSEYSRYLANKWAKVLNIPTEEFEGISHYEDTLSQDFI